MEKTTRYKFLCHSYYLVFGMLGIGILPALIKDFEDTFGFTHAQMGLQMGVASVLFSVAALVGGVFYDRYGARVVMNWTLALCAIAALCIAGAPTAVVFVPALLFLQFANGLGSCVNAFVGRIYRQDRTRGISLLHAFQGIGRFLGPMVVWGCLAVGGHWRWSFVVAAAAFVVWFGLFFFWFRNFPAHLTASPPPSAGGKGGIANLLDWRLLLGLSGFTFGIGCEGVLINWMRNFLQMEAGFPRNQALLALTLLMAGMMATRLLLGLRRAGAGAGFIVCSAALTVAMLLGLTRVTNVFWLQPMAFLLGAAIGGMWPCLAGALFDYRPHRQGTLTGLILIFSSAGAMLFIPTAGKIGDAYGLGKALLIAPACAIIYAIIYCTFRLVSRKKATHLQN